MTDTTPLVFDEFHGANFTAYNGDSCEVLKGLPENSIDMSVYSPPFADLFVYSNSDRDLGNSKDWSEFFGHYSYIIRELLRVTKPGRITCAHTADIPAMDSRDDYIGMKDFPGAVIRAYEENGWIYHGCAYVQKNPQALRNGTPVLTPYGWTEIQNLKIGDVVTGLNGKSTSILGVYPHSDKRMFRVTFTDGAWVDCHSEHIWTVKSVNSSWINKTTDELFTKGITCENGTPKYRIPIVAPVEFEQKEELPIDPYLLGVLLGDGGISQDRTVEVCTDDEIIKSLKLPEGHKIVYRKDTNKMNGLVQTASIVCNEWHKNDVLEALRNMNLQGRRAWEKFIPLQYQYANIENRRKILSGLLDTDGTVKNTGSVKYSTTSKQLADDIKNLVLSLGGICLVKEMQGSKYTCQNEERTGRNIFELSVQLFDTACPFMLKRKADKWHPRQRGFWRSIKSIERVDRDNCTCITVSNEDGLFVTKDYIVTHNSQAIRVKAKGLAFAQLRRDSAACRPALVDRVIMFRKDGENKVPVLPVENGEMTNETWINWANGIWLGISESDTLQYTTARDPEDERHICPLQLGTIERCVKLYSNPGETVLTPFMGIGSEAYQALRFGRKAIGIELKPSYYRVAVQNLQNIEAQTTKNIFNWNA